MEWIKINQGLVINKNKLVSIMKAKNYPNQTYLIEFSFENTKQITSFKNEQSRDDVFTKVTEQLFN